MKKIFPFLILISLTLISFGQETVDILYLKNGSAIMGKLIEMNDNTYSIRKSDGSIYVYKLDEVEGFEYQVKNSVRHDINRMGFGIEAGFLIGTQEAEYTAPLSFTVSGILNIDEIHSFAVGSGVEFIGQSYAPVFLQYKAMFFKERVSPFLFTRAGALVYLGDNIEDSRIGKHYDSNRTGGFMANCGIGVSWGGDNYDMYLSFAYRFARTSYTEETWSMYESVTIKTNYKRLEIKAGIQF